MFVPGKVSYGQESEVVWKKTWLLSVLEANSVREMKNLENRDWKDTLISIYYTDVEAFCQIIKHGIISNYNDKEYERGCAYMVIYGYIYILINMKAQLIVRMDLWSGKKKSLLILFKGGAFTYRLPAGEENSTYKNRMKSEENIPAACGKIL